MATHMERVVPGGGVGEFALETVTPAAAGEEQGEFCPAVRGPEVGVMRIEEAQQLPDDEPLERCAGLRVAGDVGVAWQSEQRMQEAGIAHVDFRRLDLPLLRVCEPVVLGPPILVC